MIAKHKGEIPVVVLLLPFLAGISGALYFLNTSNSFVLAALLILSLSFITFNLAYTPLRIYKVRWLGGLLIYPTLCLLGWFITTEHNELNNTAHFAKLPARQLIAVISSEPVVKNDMVRFTANIKQSINNKQIQNTNGTLLITIKDELAKNLFYGEQLLIPASYTPANPPFNPGEFNYKQYLANKNVYYQASLYPNQYRVIAACKGSPVITYALKLRQNLVEKLKRNLHDTTAIAVASTLILGYKADLSNDVLQAYSKTGTIHILSVSGGHVAIIYLLLGWALTFLNTSHRGRIIKAVVIITLIWAYALLTGFSPAVCRAAVMISLLISGKTYSRYISTLNLLATSAFALLLYNPLLLADVGFQLSYLAVSGLVVFQPIIYRWFNFKNKLADKIWLACSVSVAAQAITFPLSAYYFHQFPVYFLVSNLLIAIPVFIIMYSGLLLLLLPQMPWVSAALGYVLENTILLMNKALGLIEHSPYAAINKIWLSKPEYLLLCALIMLLFYFLHTPKKWLVKAMLMCLLFFGISIGLKKIRADNTSSVTFLNLRKHTGIVFKNGSHGVVLTNLPQTDKNFQYSVQPCLDSSRITGYQVYNLDKDIDLPWFKKVNNLVQFQNKKLLLLYDKAKFKSIPRQAGIDYVLISNNTGYDKTMLQGKTIIINADNTDNYIQDFLAENKNAAGNYKILKRNKSICIVSN
ncbi:ComEC/Rec2 family competence protein [Mucilaginibacter phyllosphaerae]|uniref:ComEC family competence protein n=1 Tax=Mucilaginibacter phyllosphaerae TaxID=1812349 RepID=A0A4Y8AIC0_9SPHI|nr:ComEC/Rec2 family competence protein [Mucilaginibacter phyllosphaerae]MBB3968158.1 competence protein ComEC [Mucilaginibacter phyllosphaerae]TEW68827.1 ComEC family competence protein [Mucilaginibacter phyllosphaerae]GGH00855.1 competence protein [Mucilaginibacter phyllosphaerae]